MSKLKLAKPLSLHPRGATMRLIERFARWRKRTTLEVLRAYKSQGPDVKRRMLEDMQRLLDEDAERERAEEAAANTATLGDPGAKRFEAIMARSRLLAASRGEGPKVA